MTWHIIPLAKTLFNLHCTYRVFVQSSTVCPHLCLQCIQVILKTKDQTLFEICDQLGFTIWEQQEESTLIVRLLGVFWERRR